MSYHIILYYTNYIILLLYLIKQIVAPFLNDIICYIILYHHIIFYLRQILAPLLDQLLDINICYIVLNFR